MMARLVLTHAEKDAARYLDWDDAALGKLLRLGLLHLAAKREEYSTEDELHGTRFWTALVFLAHQAGLLNADWLSVVLRGASCGKENLGDWRITFRRLRPRAAQEYHP